MRIAVIPARGGSKRIPRKNIRPFCGKPMIAYAIETALASALFEHVVVSTDDDEIAEVALRYGAEVPFRRPSILADDHTGTLPVMAHAIERCQSMGWDVDAACCIYPAVPLLQPSDLREGCRLLEKSGEEFAFPIVAFPSAIQRALHMLPDGHVKPMHPEYTGTRTQDLEPAYYDAGQFYWGLTTAWLRGVSPHQVGVAMAIPEWRAVDVDTPSDWRRAELLYRVLQRELDDYAEEKPF